MWVIDPDHPTWSSHFVSEWSIFQAVGIPDVDGDGISDLVVSHGGDQTKEPQEHDRRPGRIIMLSGRSGKPIGDYYLELPKHQETYMSPVKYVTKDGAVYILYGSGGETIKGILYKYK